MESSPRSLLKLEERSCSTDGNYITVSPCFSLAPPSWCHWCPQWQWPTQVPNKVWRVRQPQAPLRGTSNLLSKALSSLAPSPCSPVSFLAFLSYLLISCCTLTGWSPKCSPGLQLLPSFYWLGSRPSLLPAQKTWPQISLLFQLLRTPVRTQSKPWSPVIWIWAYSPWPCPCHG